MTTLREAAQQALEYMKFIGKMDMHPEKWAIIGRLEAALAEPVQEPDSPERRCGGPGCDMRCCQPVQEPVAGVVLNEEGRAALVEHGREEWHCVVRNARRLYTAPPQRKPLSEDEKRALADKFLSCQPESYEVSGVFDLISAVERAHGIGGEG